MNSEESSTLQVKPKTKLSKKAAKAEALEAAKVLALEEANPEKDTVVALDSMQTSSPEVFKMPADDEKVVRICSCLSASNNSTPFLLTNPVSESVCNHSQQ